MLKIFHPYNLGNWNLTISQKLRVGQKNYRSKNHSQIDPDLSCKFEQFLRKKFAYLL